jgi:hypothetical protein
VVFHDPQKNIGMQFMELPGALFADAVRFYTGSAGGPPLNGAVRYRLGAKGSLRGIVLSESPLPGLSTCDRSYVGIYELSGDRLKLCLNLGPWVKPDSPARTAYPEKFEAPKGSGLTLLTLKRAKEAK